MAEGILEIRNLDKSFGDNVILRDVSFNLKPGEILGLMGPSGGGKSTILKLIIGLIQPDGGQILFEGADLTALSERELSRIRARIGYVFQEGALFDSMTVEENLSYPLQKHTALGDEEILSRVNERLGLVGMEGKNLLYPNEISGGMQKRVGFLRATMLEPRIVLFDEPTSGLDPRSVENFIYLIHQIRKRTLLSGIFISHDPAAVLAICDRIAVLWNGSLLFESVESAPRSNNPIVRSFFRTDYRKEPDEQAS